MSKIAEDSVITYSLTTRAYCETTFAKKIHSHSLSTVYEIRIHQTLL